MKEFKSDLHRGKLGEKVMTHWFWPWYKVEKSTMAQERQGYDFIVTSRTSGKRYTLEVKTDEQAAKTGNIAIETISVKEEGKEGWALTSTADILAYYIWSDWVVMFFDMATVREHAKTKSSRYKKCLIPNRGYNGNVYHTEIYLLPRREAEKMAFSIKRNVSYEWMKENYIQWRNQTT